MRIVHVVPDLSPASGGQAAAAIRLCDGLVRCGSDVILLTTDFGIALAAYPPRVDVRTVRSLLSRLRWSPALARALRSLLSEFAVVHLHGLWLHPIWAAGRVCRSLGLPYLVTPCGMLDRWSLAQRPWRKRLHTLLFERHTLHGAAAIQFTSDAERERSVTFGSPAPACVVPLGLPQTAWENLPARGRFRLRTGLGERRVVLFLGRLHTKKRPDLLIRAFALTAQEFPDSVLVLAGPGEPVYVSRLRSHAASLGLDNRVLFPGLLCGGAVQEALVDADVFALPSLQENFALSVAEAMAAACPVIVSPHVALAEEVDKHGAGIVVEPELEQLAGSLRQLLDDKCRRQLMGRNGRRLVMDRYTLEQTTEQMMTVYEDIAQGTRRSLAWR